MDNITTQKLKPISANASNVPSDLLQQVCVIVMMASRQLPLDIFTTCIYQILRLYV